MNYFPGSYWRNGMRLVVRWPQKTFEIPSGGNEPKCCPMRRKVYRIIRVRILARLERSGVFFLYLFYFFVYIWLEKIDSGVRSAGMLPEVVRRTRTRWPPSAPNLHRAQCTMGRQTAHMHNTCVLHFYLSRPCSNPYHFSINGNPRMYRLCLYFTWKFIYLRILYCLITNWKISQVKPIRNSLNNWTLVPLENTDRRIKIYTECKIVLNKLASQSQRSFPNKTPLLKTIDMIRRTHKQEHRRFSPNLGMENDHTRHRSRAHNSA